MIGYKSTLRVFANSRGNPKNKFISIGSFTRKKLQNYSTPWTGIRNIPHDVQGVQGEKAANTMLLQRKNTNEY